MKQSWGCLYLVATPIGNLADMSLRAITTLQAVALIAAEDTRHCRVLLDHYAITTPTCSLHQHNEQQRINQLLSRLQQGQDVALISDAGTPLISDPGHRLVAAVQQAGGVVQAIPGACALISALVSSGLPTTPFTFIGFLPTKHRARATAIAKLVQLEHTAIVYEAPHRLQRLLAELIEVGEGDRSVVLARELTKRFETVLTGSVAQLQAVLHADSNQTKGEMVLLLAGRVAAAAQASDEQLNSVLAVLLQEVPLSQAVKLAAQLCQLKRNDVYPQAIALQQRLANQTDSAN